MTERSGCHHGLSEVTIPELAVLTEENHENAQSNSWPLG
jgi:hypothetical protein